MSHHHPLVSVVIPAYNAAGHLRSTIDSVLAQTYPVFEVIVVDDGSSDDTSRVAQTFAAVDSRVRVIRQANGGVGAARNAGIRASRGKYIAPLDADDLWAPTKLEQQVARIERAGPQAGLAYCWSRNVDAAERVISWNHPFRLEGCVGSAMMLGNFVGNASVPLFRASAIAAVGGYLTREDQAGAQGCEDWDLNIRIAEKFSVCCVPEYLVSYRQATTSMSLAARSMARSFEIALRRAYLRDPQLPPTLLRWSASRFYLYLLSKCYGWSNYTAALRALAVCLKQDPAAWLTGRTYRIAVLSVFHLATAGAFRRRRTPPAVSILPDPLFQLPPPPVMESKTWFALLQSRRMRFALEQRWRSRPHVRIKRAFVH
jgi:glycosyltransferase involved in cell wall biosynthesis